MKEYSYWLDTVDQHASQTVSQSPDINLQSARHDVVVVGAGYTGLAAARQLASSGASVLVVERESIGWGASSRNAGQVLTGLKLEPRTLLARFGERRARALFDVAGAALDRIESLIAAEAIDCQYERTGHLQAACKPAHFREFRQDQAVLARVFDHRVELVSRAGQRSEVGSDVYYGLLVDERSGRLNPARYVHGLSAAARRAGARIAAGVRVTKIRRQDARGSIVSTTAGDVAASDVLLATDGYTDDASPALRRRFVPVGSYIVVTAPLSPDLAASLLPHGRTAFDSKHFLHYFRVTSDRRLLFGGRAEFSQPDASATRRAADTLRRGFEAVFPQLAGTPVEYAWSGIVGFTRDQLPHAGRLGGIYYAGGYCGHGIAMATHLGEQIARRIAGETFDHPLFDDRFPAIPLYSGKPWFLPFVGAYYRIRDFIG